MRKELSDRLRNKHVNLFGSVGFECMDGWFLVLDSIANVISPVDNGTAATQIKEKYGTLRFYYYVNTDPEVTGIGEEFVEGAVWMGELLTDSICEECGAPGVEQGEAFIRTLCGRHAKGAVIDPPHVDHIFGLGQGWSRVVAALVNVLDFNVRENDGPVVTVSAAKLDGRLVVTATGGEREAGMVALINEYGNRLDEITGEPVGGEQ